MGLAFAVIGWVILIFWRCHVEKITCVWIAWEVLAVVFAPLHVCVTIALGEVFAGMGQPFKASRYLAVIEIDSVHYFGLVCCLVRV